MPATHVRTVTTLQQSKVYGTDDQGQERYLGNILSLASDQHVISQIVDRVNHQRRFYSTVDEAAQALHEQLVDSGYLQSDHRNYLRSSS